MRRWVAVAVLVAGLALGATTASAASTISFSRPIPVQHSGIAALRSWGGASCPSARLCVATDGTPRILTSTNPTGGRRAWAAGMVGSFGFIADIACPSISLCAATGADSGLDGFYTSTDPAGGAATWYRTRRRGGRKRGWFDVNCPNGRLCVAAGSGFGVSTDPARPGSWRHIPEPANGDQIKGITGISCSSPHLCVGADLFGLAFVSTDPRGGVHAWHVIRVHRHTLVGGNAKVGCSRSRAPVCVVAATASEWLAVGHVRPARRHRGR
jgi:hypothetical protein